MIQLFFTLILIKMAVIMSLVFETPLKRLGIMELDRLKQGRGLMISRTVEGVLFCALVSTIYSITKTHQRLMDADLVNPMDEVLVSNKILLASLMGFLLFFSMLIDRLHQLVREHSSLQRMIIAEEKQLGERKYQIAERLKTLEKEITPLKTVVKNLEVECERKSNHVKRAKAKELALRKQSEGFELEYDRLLEYNQTLQSQLQSIDECLLKANQERGWTSFKSHTWREGLAQYAWDIHPSTKSRGESGPQSDVQTTDQSVHYLCSGGRAVSLPRHRRPIHQQMSLTL